MKRDEENMTPEPELMHASATLPPPCRFSSTALANGTDACGRFQRLTSSIMDTEWWIKLLKRGAVIAGGAALFVAGEDACIDDVSDIDVWIRFSEEDEGEGGKVPLVPSIVKEMVEWLSSHKEAYKIRVQPSIITVISACMTVQFIYEFKKNASQVLSLFDLDVVQCALLWDASLNSVSLLLSDAAKEAIRTKVILWYNRKGWAFRNLPEESRQKILASRMRNRMEKYQKKGYCCHPSRPVSRTFPHVCEHERNRRDDALRDASLPATGTLYSSFADCIGVISDLCRFIPIRIEDYETQDGEIIKAPPLPTPPPPMNSFDLAQVVGSWSSLKNGPAVMGSEKFGLQHINLPLWRAKAYAYRTTFESLVPEEKWDRIQWFGIRNLKMLEDVNTHVAKVKASVNSDALKCGRGSSEGMGLALMASLLFPRREKADDEQEMEAFKDIVFYFFDDQWDAFKAAASVANK